MKSEKAVLRDWDVLEIMNYNPKTQVESTDGEIILAVDQRNGLIKDQFGSVFYLNAFSTSEWVIHRK